ncbi:MAG: GNAT family N-acetyltransferase [Candidatus Cloacimonetes bacterium]|nr:GNAT family N-acetyltransferase [Candidatus Cloacimonadota bacterium]
MPEIKYFWENPVDLSLIREAWEAAFSRVLPVSTWEKVWIWRFQANPACEQALAAYILEDDRIACFYAVSPMTIMHPDGSKIKSGLMNMGFTHPEFQGRGYYLELNVRMHERLKSMGYECLFGFANHNSHYSYRKHLNWQDLSLLTNFQLLKNTVKSGLLKNGEYQTDDIELNETVVDSMGSCFVTEERYHIQRSAAFLKWRLIENPTQKYLCLTTFRSGDILAYTVYKRFGRNEVDIMEIFYTTIGLTAYKEILASIMSCLLSKGINSINIWSNLFSDEHLELEKMGFREHNVSTHFGVIDFSGRKDISLISNWHYRFIDSDVY